jgi:hypothetical protein
MARRSLAALACVLLGVGCTRIASAPVGRVLIGGQAAMRTPRGDATRTPEPAGDCQLSCTVRVVDASGARVAGARVEVRQRVSETASGDTLAIWQYMTGPRVTDRKGEARVCAPGALRPEPEWQGIGGGYTDRGAGSIEVSVGTSRATVAGSSAMLIVVRL